LSQNAFVRPALCGDISCPLANSSDDELHYINADYTMLIGRYAAGESVGVEVAQQIDADGISMGRPRSSTGADRSLKRQRRVCRLPSGCGG
jgi:hypothetical protein